jgi:hypothetical protein
MNSLLPRGVPKREQPMPCSQANDADIGLFADLIGVDTALGARNQLKAVENWPVGWFFCKLLRNGRQMESPASPPLKSQPEVRSSQVVSA